MSDDDHNLDDLKERLYRSFGVDVRLDLQVRAEIVIQPEEGRWVFSPDDSGIWRTASSPYCSIQAREQDGRSVSRSSNTSGCSVPYSHTWATRSRTRPRVDRGNSAMVAILVVFVDPLKAW